LNRRRRGRGAPSILAPIVMGEGRAAWDAAYADAHAHGTMTQTSRLLHKTEVATNCTICDRPVVPGAYVVRSRMRAGWEHARCVGSDVEPRVFRRHWKGGKCAECGGEIGPGSEIGRRVWPEGAIRLVHAACARDAGFRREGGLPKRAILPDSHPESVSGQRQAREQSPHRVRPIDSSCAVCGAKFVLGQTIIPLGAVAPTTRWAHRECRPAAR